MIRLNLTSTVVNDAALRALQVRLSGLRDKCATVGWHAPEGTRPKQVRRGKGVVASNWRTNLASVALIHEAGSPARNIPARPVHRTAARNAEYRRGLVSLTVTEYRGLLAGRSADSVLRRMGDYWRSRFDLVFDGENSWPALSETTLLRRASNGNLSTQPLVDTRQMRDTTTARVQLSMLVERPVWGAA